MDNEGEAHDGQGPSNGADNGLRRCEEEGRQDEEGRCADTVEDADKSPSGGQLPAHIPSCLWPTHLCTGAKGS